MNKSKNDLAWEKIFEKYQILEKVQDNGHTLISSTNINEFREARLMTKFDHKSQLPKLFSDNNLSILPTSRGGYVIGAFETFRNFNIDDVEVTRIEFPTFLESLDYRFITSESTAINCAFVTKILHDFLEEDNLLPTVSGRMSSSAFNFKINAINNLFNVNVGNSQIEIDGGYEGDNSLSLIEAKNYISDDFLIRQLYYPYRLWNNKISKQVKPIFLTYTNGIFHLREYAFTDVEHYNSIVLVKQKKYVVQEGNFNIEIVQEILNNVVITKEPEIPFPQANNFERVINLCELLKQKEFITKEEITSNYDFDARQTDYYINAGKYLGVLQIGRDPGTNQIGCFLTNKGKQIFNINIVDRQKEFVKIIVAHSAFKKTLELYFELGEMPSKNEIIDIMKSSNLYNIDSDSTYFRRASTIIGWINWIMKQIEE
ncbi:transcriptional regulator [Chryseobacterium piscium]|uniref:Transcriptional regulator n=1 Tax=Chryseobacterium piscium TaxID=333702 RepID=A0A3D9B9L3_9FLAO|nr:transcriptional regulator [Chryseobacterium piscium]REC50441.1 transcriptional regulator [Chryseobacterium piscium]